MLKVRDFGVDLFEQRLNVHEKYPTSLLRIRGVPWPIALRESDIKDVDHPMSSTG